MVRGQTPGCPPTPRGTRAPSEPAQTRASPALAPSHPPTEKHGRAKQPLLVVSDLPRLRRAGEEGGCTLWRGSRRLGYLAIPLPWLRRTASRPADPFPGGTERASRGDSPPSANRSACFPFGGGTPFPVPAGGGRVSSRGKERAPGATCIRGTSSLWVFLPPVLGEGDREGQGEAPPLHGRTDPCKQALALRSPEEGAWREGPRSGPGGFSLSLGLPRSLSSSVAGDSRF